MKQKTNYIILITASLVLSTSLYSATALAAVEVGQQIDLWNILLAAVVLVSGWAALKGKVQRLEAAQAELKEAVEEASHLGIENQVKILKLKTEIFEKLIKQERLLFEKVDERITRLEGKIDRLIQKNHRS